MTTTLEPLPTSLSEFWRDVVSHKESSIEDLQHYIQRLADHRMIVMETFVKVTQNMSDIYLVIDGKYHLIQTISDKRSKFHLFPKNMIENVSESTILFPFTLIIYSELVQFPILFDMEDID